jgi:hypothetical protein
MSSSFQGAYLLSCLASDPSQSDQLLHLLENIIGSDDNAVADHGVDKEGYASSKFSFLESVIFQYLPLMV